MKDKSKICPIVSNGKCRFSKETMTNSFRKPQVFFAFDNVSSSNKDYRHLQELVKKSIESLINNLGYEFIAYDTSNMEGLDWFCNKICYQIQNSALLIADISTYQKISSKYSINPNVALELGLALGFGTKTLLMTSTPEKSIPADLRNFEIYKFDEDIKNGKFKNAIVNSLTNQNISSGFELISNKSIYIEKILDIESITSDWLLALDYHSYLFRSIESLRKLAKDNSSDEDDYQKRIEFTEKRWNNLRRLLRNDNDIKVYHIYETKGIKDYFSTGVERRKSSPNSEFVESSFLISEIEETKKLIKEFYPKLQIAFTDRHMPYAFLVRPNHCSIIDSKSDMNDALNAIIASYYGIVEELERTFWIYWNEIPYENKTKNYILDYYDYLKSLIKK